MEEGLIKSRSQAVEFTSANFKKLKEDIASTYEESLRLKRKLRVAQLVKWVAFSVWLFTFYVESINKEKQKRFNDVVEVKAAINKTYVEIKFANDAQKEKAWLEVIEAFEELKKSQKIWDLTFSVKVDKVKLRSIADSNIERKEIKFIDKYLDFLKTDLKPLLFNNINGPDIYIYPEFLLMHRDNKKIGIFDIKDIDFSLDFTAFIETDKVPTDSEIISHTWAKTNKDGSPDRRFNGNFQIPVLKYGQMILLAENIIQEAFMFSNIEAYDLFVKALNRFLQVVGTSKT